MKVSRLQPVPLFDEFQKLLVVHLEWLQTCLGTFFRFQSNDFPAAKELFGGHRAHGWRRAEPAKIAFAIRKYREATDPLAGLQVDKMPVTVVGETGVR